MSEAILSGQEAPVTEEAPAAETAPETSPAPAASAEDWTSTLPEEERIAAQAAGLKSMADMAKSWRSGQKMIGRDKIPMPKTPEEYMDVYNRLGRPKEATEYGLGMPEGLPEGMPAEATQEFIDAAQGKFHELGFTKEQATNLHNWYWATNLKSFDDAKVQTETAWDQRVEGLKSEWGTDFNANVRLATQVVQKFAGDDAESLLASLDTGFDPLLVKMLAKMGKSFAGDGSLVNAEGKAVVAPSQARTEAEHIMASDPAYLDSYHPQHAAAKAKVTALFRSASQ